jgi:predicted MFS family arabinose efflux permease
MGRLDYVGAALSLLAVASFILALNTGQTSGWGSPGALGLSALFAISGSLFVARQLKAEDPLVSPALLRNRRFLLANAVSASGLIVMGGNSFLMPFFLEREKGLPTEQAGLMLLVYSLAFVILSPLAGRLADRISPARMCAAGMGLGAVACLLFASTMSSPGLAGTALFLAVLAVAYALFMAANAKEVLGAAPTEHEGAASAVFGTLYTLGLLLGVGIFETLYADAPPMSPAQTTGGWLPGFSTAYLVGACACVVSCVLALAISRSDGERRAGGG